MNNPPDHDAMLELVAAYALGVLTPSESQLAGAYIAQNAEARAEFEALRPTADLIGLIAEEPVDSARSARMKQRLMTAVTSQAARAPSTFAAVRNDNRRSSWFVGAGLATAAAIVFALVSTIQNFSLRGDLANANARAATLQAQIAQNERVRTRDREMIADLVAGDAQRYPVPEGEVVKHGSHLYLTLHSLPPLPHGKVYQAWTLTRGMKTVTPSIVFTPSASGVAVVALPENADNLAAVAVSVEPEGGSKAPTSKPTFVRPLT
jgi:anti-sigma-K factor RskA